MNTADIEPAALDPTHFELHIVVDSSQATVIEQLKANTPLSTQALKKALSNGAVWLESAQGIQRIRRAKKILAAGDRLHLYYDEIIQNTKPEAAVLVADEGEYSIWNKPYGMYSQGTKWGDQNTVYRWAEQYLEPQRNAFIVHRLDRAATGLIIITHTKKMAKTFSAMFREHKIKKYYRAGVANTELLPELPFCISSDIDNKPAITRIIRQQLNDDDSRTLTIEIETGRKHQIRRHLAESGMPIIGDRLYGIKPYTNDLQLSAVLLEFTCPLTDTLKTYSLEVDSHNTNAATTPP